MGLVYESLNFFGHEAGTGGLHCVRRYSRALSKVSWPLEAHTSEWDVAVKVMKKGSL